MDESNPVYSLKRIKFFSRDVAIVCQNENGPCPLLAIVNVLSLRNQIKLPSLADHIDQVMMMTMGSAHHPLQTINPPPPSSGASDCTGCKLSHRVQRAPR